MKSLLFFLLVFSSFASAKTSLFECEFPSLSNDNDKIMITIDDIDDASKVSLNYDHYEFDGYEAAFSFGGGDLEWLYMMLISGDGQGIEIDSNGDLILGINDASCDVGKIHLYGNNKFKYGYVSIQHKCTGPNVRSYSKVRCEIN